MASVTSPRRRKLFDNTDELYLVETISKGIRKIQLGTASRYEAEAFAYELASALGKFGVVVLHEFDLRLADPAVSLGKPVEVFDVQETLPDGTRRIISRLASRAHAEGYSGGHNKLKLLGEAEPVPASGVAIEKNARVIGAGKAVSA